jgi:hypothetical protein
LSLLHIAQFGSETHPGYPTDAGALSSGVKRPGSEGDYLAASSVEAKKMWMHTFTPHTPLLIALLNTRTTLPLPVLTSIDFSVGARGDADSCGALAKAGRSRVRIPMI